MITKKIFFIDFILLLLILFKKIIYTAGDSESTSVSDTGPVNDQAPEKETPCGHYRAAAPTTTMRPEKETLCTTCSHSTRTETETAPVTKEPLGSHSTWPDTETRCRLSTWPRRDLTKEGNNWEIFSSILCNYKQRLPPFFAVPDLIPQTNTVIFTLPLTVQCFAFWSDFFKQLLPSALRYKHKLAR